MNYGKSMTQCHIAAIIMASKKHKNHGASKMLSAERIVLATLKQPIMAEKSAVKHLN